MRRFRTACQNAILLDFETARDTNVEGRLWDAHLKLNTRFRKLLSRVSADAPNDPPGLQLANGCDTIVPRGKRKKEACREAQAREALPGLYQVEPAVLSGIHPAPLVALWRHCGTGQGRAQVQL